MDENRYYTSGIVMLYPADMGETISERENFARYSLWLELVGEDHDGSAVTDVTQLSYCLN